jgi:hypothetical protein
MMTYIGMKLHPDHLNSKLGGRGFSQGKMKVPLGKEEGMGTVQTRAIAVRPTSEQSRVTLYTPISYW